jgi:uncharacterized protein (TIGR01777 family)
MKKVIITGATGLVGRNLLSELLKSNYKVIALIRDIYKASKIIPSEVELIQWDFKSSNNKSEVLENAFSIIHLAGAGVFSKRWNESFKNEIYSSRVDSTKKLIEIISKLDNKPENFIVASGVGYYGNRADEILTEDSTAGDDFLAKVCIDWEKEASKVEQIGVRWSSIRTGIVLSTDGGALKKMLLPFKLFIGGHLGSGRQWFPWIHLQDIIGIYKFTVENKNCVGPINAASPQSLRMKQFSEILAKVLSRPNHFPVPEFILKFILGKAASDIVSSQRIDASKILKLGYNFKFPELKLALENLLLKK